MATPKSTRLETGNSFNKLLYLVQVERQTRQRQPKQNVKLTSLKFNIFCIQKKMYCKVDHTIIPTQKSTQQCALRIKLRSFPVSLFRVLSYRDLSIASVVQEVKQDFQVLSPGTDFKQCQTLNLYNETGSYAKAGLFEPALDHTLLAHDMPPP